MSQREDDVALLAKLLDRYGDQLPDDQHLKFVDMQNGLKARWQSTLTTKQRRWAMETLEHFEPRYLTEAQLSAIPRGREVESMVGPLPKRPPQKIR